MTEDVMTGEEARDFWLAQWITPAGALVHFGPSKAFIESAPTLQAAWNALAAEITRRALAAQTMGEGEWKPIETAPFDGEKIVVLTKGGRAFIASMQDVYEDDEGRCSSAWTAEEEGIHPPCWTDGVCWNENGDGEPSDKPIMWQPLPQPSPMLGGEG